MKIAPIEKSIELQLTILIIDDDKYQAFNLQENIVNYKSLLNRKRDIFNREISVVYSVIINGTDNLKFEEFDGSKAYNHSVKYLEENIKDIDIILCDYHLMGKEGSDFLKMVYIMEAQNGISIFKVLLSTGSEYQKHQQEKYVNYIFNSKDRDSVNSILFQYFEKNILNIKLMGNPLYYSTFYKENSGDILSKNDASTLIIKEEIQFIQMHYIHTTKMKENCYFSYLNSNYQIDEKPYSDSLIELNKKEIFFKVTKSLYINMLWYADYDVLKNRIKFISPTNKVCILDIKLLNDSRVQKISLMNLLNLLKTKYEFPDSHLNSFFKF